MLYGDTTATYAPQDLTADHTPPETQILIGPTDGGWTNAKVTLSWTTDNLSPTATLRYAFRLDGTPYSAPLAPTTTTYTPIAEGAHTFDVYAVDEAANADPTPATRSFNVDRVAPAVAITGGPADGDTIGVDHSIFSFAGNDDRTPTGQVTFSSSLDGSGFGAPTTSTTLGLTGLAEGTHTLSVRAYDLAGNVSAAVSRSFRVEATAPVLAQVAGPTQGQHVAAPSPVFGWTATSTSTAVPKIRIAPRWTRPPRARSPATRVPRSGRSRMAARLRGLASAGATPAHRLRYKRPSYCAVVDQVPCDVHEIPSENPRSTRRVPVAEPVAVIVPAIATAYFVPLLSVAVSVAENEPSAWIANGPGRPYEPYDVPYEPHSPLKSKSNPPTKVPRLLTSNAKRDPSV